MRAADAVREAWIPRPESHREWPELSVRAPRLAATLRRYLLQLTTFLAPRSVDVADSTLRQLARWLVANTDVTVVATSNAATSRTTSCSSPSSPAPAPRPWPRTPSGSGCA